MDYGTLKYVCDQYNTIPIKYTKFQFDICNIRAYAKFLDFWTLYRQHVFCAEADFGNQCLTYLNLFGFLSMKNRFCSFFFKLNSRLIIKFVFLCIFSHCELFLKIYFLNLPMPLHYQLLHSISMTIS